MNAAVVQSFSTPPIYTTFAEPTPNAGELAVTVTAAALHPVVKALAAGIHYGSTGELPLIPGVDGVGRLDNGARVYFGLARPPFGSFAQRSLAASWMCIPLPDALDDVTAAGLANPAMSSWVALTARAKFVPGESVLILGATGVAGQLAIQIAKRLGAHRVVAVGRNPEALVTLRALGADSVISLDQPADSLVAALRVEYDSGIDIVLDFLWGSPAQSLLQAIAQKGLRKSAPRLRFIQIGSSAGLDITLPAATLRSSGLELLGSGFGSASFDQIKLAVGELFELAAAQPLHFKVTTAPLAQIETCWNATEKATRLVFIP